MRAVKMSGDPWQVQCPEVALCRLGRWGGCLWHSLTPNLDNNADRPCRPPRSSPVRYHLGMGYLSTILPSKASEQLKKALELAPNYELAKQIRITLQKTGS
jgi:hypothetical protein